MRKLIAALVILFGLASAASAQTAYNSPTTQSQVTFSAVQPITKMISGIAGKRIYLTNITIHPAATAVVTITYGTGTNCGTGTTNFYGPATFQAGESVYDGDGNGALFVVPPGNDVCVTIATATAPGWIAYAQF